MTKTTKRDYYEVLGVSKTADAAAIKKAYRKLASRLRKVKPLFFILFIVLRERDKDMNNTSKTDTLFIFGHYCFGHVTDNQLYIFLA